LLSYFPRDNRVLRNPKESRVRNAFVRTSMIVGLTFVTAGLAFAQEAVVLPGSPATSTTLTANVSEQARVTVPGIVTFNVTNIAAITASTPVSVTVDNIVLATAAKTLRMSVQASAAAFTPSVASAATWAAVDVSWGAGTFSNGGVGTTGILALTPVPVATCAADVAACSTTNLIFSLAANSLVKRSGNHTLLMTWKFESI
jgi:hypothetical protein